MGHTIWGFMVEYAVLAWFNCAVLALIVRSRGQRLKLLEQDRDNIITIAVEAALKKGHSLGLAAAYVEHMMRGGRLVATKAAVGMTLDKTQARLDEIAEELNKLNPRLPS
jgi:hypothetical protein